MLGTQQHEHRHVEDAVTERPDGSNDERPGGIENGGRGKKEQPELEPHPERRRRRVNMLPIGE
jgi:hypothetical protein